MLTCTYQGCIRRDVITVFKVLMCTYSLSSESPSHNFRHCFLHLRCPLEVKDSIFEYKKEEERSKIILVIQGKTRFLQKMDFGLHRAVHYSTNPVYKELVEEGPICIFSLFLHESAISFMIYAVGIYAYKCPIHSTMYALL